MFVGLDLSGQYLAHSLKDYKIHNLIQMFTIMGWCVSYKTQVCISKVKVTLGGQRKTRARCVTFTFMGDFDITREKCSP
jgi:hypothetical protein